MPRVEPNYSSTEAARVRNSKLPIPTCIHMEQQRQFKYINSVPHIAKFAIRRHTSGRTHFQDKANNTQKRLDIEWLVSRREAWYRRAHTCYRTARARFLQVGKIPRAKQPHKPLLVLAARTSPRLKKNYQTRQFFGSDCWPHPTHICRNSAGLADKAPCTSVVGTDWPLSLIE